MIEYHRLSIKERGHISNLPRVFAITKILMNENGIKIKRRFLSPMSYAWSTVRVRIEQREEFKSYGAYSSSKFIQKICVIQAKDKKYIFDVSDSFPDFASSKELIEEMQLYCQVAVAPVKKRSIKSWWTKFDWY